MAGFMEGTTQTSLEFRGGTFCGVRPQGLTRSGPRPAQAEVDVEPEDDLDSDPNWAKVKQEHVLSSRLKQL